MRVHIDTLEIECGDDWVYIGDLGGGIDVFISEQDTPELFERIREELEVWKTEMAQSCATLLNTFDGIPTLNSL